MNLRSEERRTSNSSQTKLPTNWGEVMNWSSNGLTCKGIANVVNLKIEVQTPNQPTKYRNQVVLPNYNLLDTIDRRTNDLMSPSFPNKEEI